MKTFAITASEPWFKDLPDEGRYWILCVDVYLGDTKVSSGAHRYWSGVVETNGLTKDLLLSRLRDKRSVFSEDTTVVIRGFRNVI